MSKLNQLKTLFHDKLAESNVLVAIVTVVVAAFKVHLKGNQNDFDNHSGHNRVHSCFLNQLLRTKRSRKHNHQLNIELQLQRTQPPNYSIDRAGRISKISVWEG